MSWSGPFSPCGICVQCVVYLVLLYIWRNIPFSFIVRNNCRWTGTGLISSSNVALVCSGESVCAVVPSYSTCSSAAVVKFSYISMSTFACSYKNKKNCERSEPVTLVGWRISLVYNYNNYIFVCIHGQSFGPAWAPVTRSALT